MTININESFLTEKAQDYAKLSELAYADWKMGSNGWELDAYDENNQLKKGYDRYLDLWRDLKAPEKGYTIADHTPNDPLTGFSATIFQKDGKNILAIRGTEPDDNFDLRADWELGADKVLPYAQFQSLVEYINDKGLNGFDITGHSLGGFLAQVAKATFTGRVADVYTYNAPGPKDLQQFDYRGVDAQGNVTLAYLPKIFAPEDPDPYISFTWPPSTYTAYQTFFANQQSSAMDSHVYNVSGGIWSAPIAGTGTDIGSEVFTSTSSHSIQEMIYSLQRGKYYIDPHKPVTFVGSKADEIIDGLSLTGTSITNPIQPLTLMGGYGNDKLYGSDGDDTLYGDMAPDVPMATTGNSSPDAKAGNDHLYGGRGNDRLIGGEGDDVYHIRCGEGNDTIEDTSGVNTIVYTDGNGMSRTLKFFYATSSSSWSTPDGKATLSGNTITMEDGYTITLSAGTGLENFGIHKLDKPEDAENFNAIPGEDGKNDTLFDTAGNDKIEGKSGCDIIAVLHGGNDWVLGGADDDDVMVKADLTGNILIEGNAGMDMIAGGGGNDRIFCENKEEMVDLVEAGETAENLDIWGERANGMGGNDFIYGSQAKDLLLGGTGSDLVVGACTLWWSRKRFYQQRPPFNRNQLKLVNQLSNNNHCS